MLEKTLESPLDCKEIQLVHPEGDQSWAQLCLTLCNPIDCSLPGISVHGDSSGKNTGVGCHAFLQEIFPTQKSNPGLPHCRQILYHLSYQGSPAGGIFLVLSTVTYRDYMISWAVVLLPVCSFVQANFKLLERY